MSSSPCRITFFSMLRPHKEVDGHGGDPYLGPVSFNVTPSQGGRQQIPTNIANICINSSLFCTPHPFLHTFILQFRITFPLCCSYIQSESLGIFCPLYIRTKELTAQSHQSWLYSNMLHFAFILISQIIKSQTVRFLVCAAPFSSGAVPHSPPPHP